MDYTTTQGITTDTAQIGSLVITQGGIDRLPASKERIKAARKERSSLTLGQLKAIVNAEKFAASQGTELAAHVTIHWRASQSFADMAASSSPAEIDREWAKRLRRFLDKLNRWLARKGSPGAYVWVNEVGKDYGEHTHLFLHLPHPSKLATGNTTVRQAAFDKLKDDLVAFIYETEGLKNYAKGPVFRSKAVAINVGRSLQPGVKPFGLRTPSRRAGVLRYFAKGLSPTEKIKTGFGCVPLAKHLRIDLKASKRPFTNRRYGTSNSIGPKAQREAGFPQISSVEEVYAALWPN